MRGSLWIFFLIYSLITLLGGTAAHAQTQPGNTALINGSVKDTAGLPLQNVRVRVKETRASVLTGEHGLFMLTVPADQILHIDFLYLNDVKHSVTIAPLKPGDERPMNVRIDIKLRGAEVVIKGQAGPRPFVQRIDLDAYNGIPNPSGGVEQNLKMLAGVSSNNEMSSQYSVRGGNFDENLVYINDIEIYRPQLVRAGEQEGLSIINSDLVSNLEFSAGGFEARYGDKLSSVLDIRYKEPDSFFARSSVSLLGASGAVGFASKDRRFRVLTGARYRTNQYLLNSLDVQADYRPAFGDAQAYFSFQPNDKWHFGYLTYYGSNRYLSYPQTQETNFGSVQAVLRLRVAFEGKELLRYNSLLNGLTVTHTPNEHNTFKWITSAYSSVEEELFDVIAAYRLQQLENDPGSEDFGDVKYTLGVGGYLNHGRNRLSSAIYNTELKGRHEYGNLMDLQWGAKAQREEISDRLNEYRYIDSADYSVPQGDSGRKSLDVYEYIFSRNIQSWNRYMGYVQNTFVLDEYRNTMLTVGVRANYWDFNKELLISPRAQFSIEPNAAYNRGLLESGGDSSLLRRSYRLKASAGVYDQPPFYRELRNLKGELNPAIRAQKSIQYVAGSDFFFNKWGRTFKLTTEAWYKDLRDIIPYEIDNVRVRYFANNNARGYATGLDLQLNGELVKDNQSWISLSFMKTAEDISDDSYTETGDNGETKTVNPGYIPRPTDQRVRAAIFFQDYLPGKPDYKVHLQLVFGSGLPFGPPNHLRYLQTSRVPPYRRVDVGFSKMLWDRNKMRTSSGFVRGFKSVWLSAELFNMFDINNTVAYLWVKDINGADWAVPRYLTGRRLNLHLEVRF